jgi:hypothetical protein
MASKSITGVPMRVFMTLLWLSVAWGPINADFNDTHILNPDWPPHAKFHMMVIFSDAVVLAIFGLVLCWAPTRSRLELLRLSALLGLLYTLGLLISAITMPLYGGSLYWTDSWPRAAVMSDPNLIVFVCTALVFLLLTIVLFKKKEG